MTKSYPLKKYADFVSEKISTKDITVLEYVTTDSILPNKQGVTIASSMPAQDTKITKYSKSDILLGNIRPYLKKIWFANRNGGCSADVLAIRAKENINPTFLYYALFRDDFFNYVMQGSKGTKMPRGDKNQIMGFSIPDLSQQDQSNIATVLEAIDAKIELNNRINSQLESLAKALYDYWFVQFDFPDSNGKPYKKHGGRMEYNQLLRREIPQGWKQGSLWEIAQYFNGLAMQKYRAKGNEFLPVIKIKEMGEGFSSQTEKASPSIPIDAVVDDGDILFSWSATLEVKIWANGKGALNQHIFKVTSKTHPKFFYFFELKNYLNHFKMMANLRKTTMGHITQDHLKQSLICIPPDYILSRAKDQIEPIFEKHLLLEKENQKLMALRDWLLPILMNGQINFH